MDFRTFSYMFRGVRPGQKVGYGPDDIRPEQHDANQKAYEYYTKKSIDQMVTVQQPAQPPQYITLTNQADGSEVRGIMEEGKFREIPVDKITTPKGTFALQTATNAAPIYLPDGSIAQNYTFDPTADEAPQTIGAYGAQPQQTPSPTPAPQAAPAPSQAPMPQTNQMVRVISPDGKRGSIPASQVDQALQQGFRLAP